jgi:hypothetical protein
MRNPAHELFGAKGLVTAVGLVALVVSMGASTADARPSATSAKGVVVAESGRIGPLYGHTLHIGRSTANDVRKAEGRKPTSSMGLMGRMGPAGKILTYRIGTGKSACKREYGFSTGSPRLGSFESNCRDTRTATGTRFGMSPRQVQGHQFAFGDYSPSMDHDCSFHSSAVATNSGSTWLVVWMKGVVGKGKLDTPNMVKSIAIYGANAPIWKAACE